MKVYCEKPAPERKVEIAQVVMFDPWPFGNDEVQLKADIGYLSTSGDFVNDSVQHTLHQTKYGWNCLVLGTDGKTYLANQDGRPVRDFLKGVAS